MEGVHSDYLELVKRVAQQKTDAARAVVDLEEKIAKLEHRFTVFEHRSAFVSATILAPHQCELQLRLSYRAFSLLSVLVDFD